jgi:hypothetical protein
MAAPSVATTLTSTVPTIVPATLKSEATTAADTEASALAMTWIGLTVSRWSPSDVEGPGRWGSGGCWGMGSRCRRAESSRLPVGATTSGAVAGVVAFSDSRFRHHSRSVQVPTYAANPRSLQVGTNR